MSEQQTNTSTMRGWYFFNHPTPKNGVWAPYKARIDPFKEGYHGGATPFDALSHAETNSSRLALCEFEGYSFISNSGALVAHRARVLARTNAIPLLKYATRQFALYLADEWEPSETVLEWLLTGDKKLEAETKRQVRFSIRSTHAELSRQRYRNGTYEVKMPAALSAAAYAVGEAYSPVTSVLLAANLTKRIEKQNWFDDIAYACFADYL